MGQGVIEISVLHEAGVLFLSEFRQRLSRKFRKFGLISKLPNASLGGWASVVVQGNRRRARRSATIRPLACQNRPRVLSARLNFVMMGIIPSRSGKWANIAASYEAANLA